MPSSLGHTNYDYSINASDNFFFTLLHMALFVCNIYTCFDLDQARIIAEKQIFIFVFPMTLKSIQFYWTGMKAESIVEFVIIQNLKAIQRLLSEKSLFIVFAEWLLFIAGKDRHSRRATYGSRHWPIEFCLSDLCLAYGNEPTALNLVIP